MSRHEISITGYHIVTVLLLFGLATSLCASQARANECPLGPPTGLFARDHNTLIYQRPDAGSKVVGRIGRGYPLLTARLPVCPGAETKPSAWIRIEGQASNLAGGPVGVQIPPGWIRRADFLEDKDFRRVAKWPFAFLIIGADVYFKVYCFHPDGKLRQQTHMEDHAPSPEHRSRLYQYQDIIAATEFEHRDDLVTPFVLYDQKRQRLCPIGLNETECDRFLEKDKGYSWQFALASDLRNAPKDSPLRKAYETYCSEKPKPPK